VVLGRHLPGAVREPPRRVRQDGREPTISCELQQIAGRVPGVGMDDSSIAYRRLQKAGWKMVSFASQQAQRRFWLAEVSIKITCGMALAVLDSHVPLLRCISEKVPYRLQPVKMTRIAVSGSICRLF
jgi:hypothetical protein